VHRTTLEHLLSLVGIYPYAAPCATDDFEPFAGGGTVGKGPQQGARKQFFLNIRKACVKLLETSIENPLDRTLEYWHKARERHTRVRPTSARIGAFPGNGSV